MGLIPPLWTFLVACGIAGVAVVGYPVPVDRGCVLRKHSGPQQSIGLTMLTDLFGEMLMTESNGKTYYVSICQRIPLNGSTSLAGAVKFNSNGEYVVLGQIDQADVVVNEKTIVLTYTGGDINTDLDNECRGNRWKTYLTFICNPYVIDDTLTLVDEDPDQPEICQIRFEIPTSKTCRRNSSVAVGVPIIYNKRNNLPFDSHINVTQNNNIINKVNKENFNKYQHDEMEYYQNNSNYTQQDSLRIREINIRKTHPNAFEYVHSKLQNSSRRLFLNESANNRMYKNDPNVPNRTNGSFVLNRHSFYEDDKSMHKVNGPNEILEQYEDSRQDFLNYNRQLYENRRLIAEKDTSKFIKDMENRHDTSQRINPFYKNNQLVGVHSDNLSPENWFQKMESEVVRKNIETQHYMEYVNKNRFNISHDYNFSNNYYEYNNSSARIVDKWLRLYNETQMRGVSPSNDHESFNKNQAANNNFFMNILFNVKRLWNGLYKSKSPPEAKNGVQNHDEIQNFELDNEQSKNRYEQYSYYMNNNKNNTRDEKSTYKLNDPNGIPGRIENSRQDFLNYNRQLYENRRFIAEKDTSKFIKDMKNRHDTSQRINPFYKNNQHVGVHSDSWLKKMESEVVRKNMLGNELFKNRYEVPEKDYTSFTNYSINKEYTPYNHKSTYRTNEPVYTDFENRREPKKSGYYNTNDTDYWNKPNDSKLHSDYFGNDRNLTNITYSKIESHREMKDANGRPNYNANNITTNNKPNYENSMYPSDYTQILNEDNRPEYNRTGENYNNTQHLVSDHQTTTVTNNSYPNNIKHNNGNNLNNIVQQNISSNENINSSGTKNDHSISSQADNSKLDNTTVENKIQTSNSSESNKNGTPVNSKNYEVGLNQSNSSINNNSYENLNQYNASVNNNNYDKNSSQSNTSMNNNSFKNSNQSDVSIINNGYNNSNQSNVGVNNENYNKNSNQSNASMNNNNYKNFNQSSASMNNNSYENSNQSNTNINNNNYKNSNQTNASMNKNNYKNLNQSSASMNNNSYENSNQSNAEVSNDNYNKNSNQSNAEVNNDNYNKNSNQSNAEVNNDNYNKNSNQSNAEVNNDNYNKNSNQSNAEVNNDNYNKNSNQSNAEVNNDNYNKNSNRSNAEVNNDNYNKNSNQTTASINTKNNVNNVNQANSNENNDVKNSNQPTTSTNNNNYQNNSNQSIVDSSNTTANVDTEETLKNKHTNKTVNNTSSVESVTDKNNTTAAILITKNKGNSQQKVNDTTPMHVDNSSIKPTNNSTNTTSIEDKTEKSKTNQTGLINTHNGNNTSNNATVESKINNIESGINKITNGPISADQSTTTEDSNTAKVLSKTKSDNTNDKQSKIMSFASKIIPKSVITIIGSIVVLPVAYFTIGTGINRFVRGISGPGQVPHSEGIQNGISFLKDLLPKKYGYENLEKSTEVNEKTPLIGPTNSKETSNEESNSKQDDRYQGSDENDYTKDQKDNNRNEGKHNENLNSLSTDSNSPKSKQQKKKKKRKKRSVNSDTTDSDDNSQNGDVKVVQKKSNGKLNQTKEKPQQSMKIDNTDESTTMKILKHTTIAPIATNSVTSPPKQNHSTLELNFPDNDILKVKDIRENNESNFPNKKIPSPLNGSSNSEEDELIEVDKDHHGKREEITSEVSTVSTSVHGERKKSAVATTTEKSEVSADVSGESIIHKENEKHVSNEGKPHGFHIGLGHGGLNIGVGDKKIGLGLSGIKVGKETEQEKEDEFIEVDKAGVKIKKPHHHGKTEEEITSEVSTVSTSVHGERKKSAVATTTEKSEVSADVSGESIIHKENEKHVSNEGKPHGFHIGLGHGGLNIGVGDKKIGLGLSGIKVGKETEQEKEDEFIEVDKAGVKIKKPHHHGKTEEEITSEVSTVSTSVHGERKKSAVATTTEKSEVSADVSGESTIHKENEKHVSNEGKPHGFHIGLGHGGLNIGVGDKKIGLGLSGIKVGKEAEQAEEDEFLGLDKAGVKIKKPHHHGKTEEEITSEVSTVSTSVHGERKKSAVATTTEKSEVSADVSGESIIHKENEKHVSNEGKPHGFHIGLGHGGLNIGVGDKKIGLGLSGIKVGKETEQEKEDEFIEVDKAGVKIKKPHHHGKTEEEITSEVSTVSTSVHGERKKSAVATTTEKSEVSADVSGESTIHKENEKHVSNEGKPHGFHIGLGHGGLNIGVGDKKIGLGLSGIKVGKETEQEKEDEFIEVDKAGVKIKKPHHHGKTEEEITSEVSTVSTSVHGERKKSAVATTTEKSEVSADVSGESTIHKENEKHVSNEGKPHGFHIGLGHGGLNIGVGDKKIGLGLSGIKVGKEAEQAEEDEFLEVDKAGVKIKKPHHHGKTEEEITSEVSTVSTSVHGERKKSAGATTTEKSEVSADVSGESIIHKENEKHVSNEGKPHGFHIGLGHGGLNIGVGDKKIGLGLSGIKVGKEAEQEKEDEFIEVDKAGVKIKKPHHHGKTEEEITSEVSTVSTSVHGERKKSAGATTTEKSEVSADVSGESIIHKENEKHVSNEGKPHGFHIGLGHGGLNIGVGDKKIGLGLSGIKVGKEAEQAEEDEFLGLDKAGVKIKKPHHHGKTEEEITSEVSTVSTSVHGERKKSAGATTTEKCEVSTVSTSVYGEMNTSEGATFTQKREYIDYMGSDDEDEDIFYETDDNIKYVDAISNDVDLEVGSYKMSGESESLKSSESISEQKTKRKKLSLPNLKLFKRSKSYLKETTSTDDSSAHGSKSVSPGELKKSFSFKSLGKLRSKSTIESPHYHYSKDLLAGFIDHERAASQTPDVVLDSSGESVTSHNKLEKKDKKKKKNKMINLFNNHLL
ncbi:uncharacterized protein LOC126838598 isoform X1 [Adelges cooleyi]|uniref:uncharacterized protein LOC126838598 isoform X1 n=1 Tax=Adelges cooleyi TaxID=133065 RepID=UPI0021804D9D|nr:uncharacterized protein LOC126838598 isoform X1 [Adelges cooleyi]